MNTLIIMVGLPRSGKSTWTKSQKPPIVNPDSIRLALHGEKYIQLAEPFVWTITKVMVRTLFITGYSTVIVDGAHTTRKRRDFWKSDNWNCVFHRIYTKKDICIERALAKNDKDIIPIIEKMNEQFEPLNKDEELYKSNE